MKILGAIAAVLFILFIVSISVTTYLMRAKANGEYIPTNEELINAYKARKKTLTDNNNNINSETENELKTQEKIITPKNIKRLTPRNRG